jgi:hypothetical protein
VIPAAGPFPYFTSTNDTLLATTNSDPPLPSCLSTDARRSVWYRFVPSAAGLYWFTTISNTATRVFDTLLAVYSTPSACAGPFTLVACNDDFQDFHAAVSATLAANATYYIVVWDAEESDPGFNTVQLGVWRVGMPAATTLSASSITRTSVVLNALVTPNVSNETTSVRFDWGTTTNYGNTTTSFTVSSNSVKLLLNSTLALNMIPTTNYHYRVVASNSKGTTNGQDRTFVLSTNRPRMTSFAFQSNGTFRFQFSGNTNQMYRVEAALNLPNWADRGPATDLGTGTFEFIEFDPAISRRTFYRLRTP